MITQLEGTVIDGGLVLDQQLTLPDQSRVRVEIVPIGDSRSRFKQALETWKELVQQRPLHLGGQRFNRDELYERG